jgi:putative membrane protein
VDWYLYVKAFHVIAMVAWMAGMFYLPRLYVYHTGAAPGSQMSETFKIMEHRLLRVIINPAMIATWGLGLVLMFSYPNWQSQGWLHAKIVLVILLTIFHIMLARWRKDFVADRNQRSEKFYRIVNEVPTLLLIFIVILVVVKPF